MPNPEIKSESPTLPLPPPRAVRITIPAAVAYNLEAFQESIGNLVERLGCRTCFSGADCTFLHERDFIINENREVRAAPQPSPWVRVDLPQPSPWVRLDNPQPCPWVRLALPGEVSNNLKQIRLVVSNIAGKLGHPNCCSGFDIQFRQELDFVANEAGEVRDRRF
jgi:hypothetical protein